ncbi:5-(carboxyamino)imidazole ribonucleotide mutase [Candidatus Sumerlaeota bacterium]|nr:5-(carboxyamino)imidazole ribonucleotide mutase [Candidatus Sumerlaeota bacterium]
MREPKIGVIMGSPSDWQVIEKALTVYKDLDLPVTVKIASAHRTPDAVIHWIKEVEKAGVEVIIAAAGLSAALPGVVASHTLLPVIGVPIESGSLQGQDALYSIVHMPPGIPVATVGINNVKNALILSLHILALKYPEFKKRLVSFRKSEAAKLEQAHKDLMKTFPQYDLKIPKMEKTVEMRIPSEIKTEVIPIPPGIKTEVIPIPPGEEAGRSVDKKKPSSPRDPFRGQIYRVDPENPAFEIIEKAADFILDGGVIAIPTDTVYGLACDSTNEKAVNKLFDFKGRKMDKPVPILIDGTKTLQKLVRGIAPEVQNMLDELWPGALTVIFPKPATMLSAVSQDPSIGIRVPDCAVTLSVISMLARPLAVTSANPSGEPPATNAQMVKDYFGSRLSFILDSGELNKSEVSTVISLVDTPYKIIRKGAISTDVLKKFLPNLEE